MLWKSNEMIYEQEPYKLYCIQEKIAIQIHVSEHMQ